MKEITYQEAVSLMFEKLGTSKIMALASSSHDVVMVRNVSCLFYNEKVYFKTDMHFRKTKQLFENPQVALCFHNIQIEGTARNCGLVVEEPGRIFEGLYKKYLWGSYNAYAHEDSEIIIEVTPTFVEIWDCDEANYAYQLFIDFLNHTVERKEYDDR